MKLDPKELEILQVELRIEGRLVPCSFWRPNTCNAGGCCDGSGLWYVRRCTGLDTHYITWPAALRYYEDFGKWPTDERFGTLAGYKTWKWQ